MRVLNGTKPGAGNFRPALCAPGDKFCRWTLIREGARKADKSRTWVCRCECGVIRVVSQQILRNGNSLSCGCRKLENVAAASRARAIHGETDKTPEWTAWYSMICRCHVETNAAYPSYGGRGITVCPRWRHSYLTFLEDMGRKPSRAHSLDRIDNNAGYSPENCRWATMREQGGNKRNNRFLEFNGERRILAEWARIVGINQTTIGVRLKAGLSVADALTIPVTNGKPRRLLDRRLLCA